MSDEQRTRKTARQKLEEMGFIYVDDDSISITFLGPKGTAVMLEALRSAEALRAERERIRGLLDGTIESDPGPPKW